MVRRRDAALLLLRPRQFVGPIGDDVETHAVHCRGLCEPERGDRGIIGFEKHDQKRQEVSKLTDGL